MEVKIVEMTKDKYYIEEKNRIEIDFQTKS